MSLLKGWEFTTSEKRIILLMLLLAVAGGIWNYLENKRYVDAVTVEVVTSESIASEADSSVQLTEIDLERIFPININLATAFELEFLPGIGKVLAERIVTERNANGLFSSIDDLLRVNGIGEKRILSLQEYVIIEVEED